jgi:regulation of enolase protein 1 (concanavalin A-like superfamily)
MTSRGFDADGTSDQFTFAYTAVRGDVTLIARVNTLSNTDPWTQTGVMIRDGTAKGARHAFAFVTPQNGVAMRTRIARNGVTSQTSGGAGVAPVWVKLERRASAFTASRSADGVSWTSIGSMAISMSSNVNVGVAVASQRSSRSVVDEPHQRQHLRQSGVDIAGRDSDGRERHGGEGRLLRWNDAHRFGHYEPLFLLLARRDCRHLCRQGSGLRQPGASTTSATATITVASNAAPVVSITAPANGASYVWPLSITLSATASDPDGTIQRVEFFVGTLLVGMDATAPYSIAWPAVIGTHSVNAVATDNAGAVTSSGWHDFVVTASIILSTAIFTPASPADSVDYYVLDVFAAGANPDVAAVTPEGKLRSNTFAFAR